MNTKNYNDEIQNIKKLIIEQVDTCKFFSPEEKKNIIKQLIEIDTLKDLIEIKIKITEKIEVLSKNLT